MLRAALLVLALVTACAGDFSVALDESSTGPSELEASGANSSDETSSSDSSSSSSPDSSVDDSTSSSSSEAGPTDTGCDDVETCIPCGEFQEPDASCAGAFPDRPLCDVEAGTCVQCSATDTSSCGGDTPVCVEGECVGCSYHDQCPDTACDAATGACFVDTCVHEVDADGGETFTSVTSALADGCVVVVHERDGGLPYTESTLISGLKIAIVAADGEQPTLQGVDGDPTFLIDQGSTVYLAGLIVRGNTAAEGISLDEATTYVDDSQIVQNGGGGVSAVGGDLVLRNSFVSGNGGNDFSATTGIRAEGTHVNIAYSTISFNDGDGADSFQCDAATGTLRNSIVLGTDPTSFACPGVSAEYTAFDDVIAGPGNVDVSPASGAWFVNPASDFHLTATGSSVFSTIAQWSDGDPSTDIDGTDPRPSSDGSADVAGADVLP